jgi:AcrR family transcriptional regulator
MPYPAKTDPASILAAALEMLEEDGPSSLSMRNLAQKLGMKAPSLYRHFADKTALEDALRFEGAHQLQVFLEPSTKKRSPKDALRTCAQNFLKFTRQHQHLYDLMHAPGVYASVGERKDLWNMVLSIVGKVTGNPDDTASSVAFWAFLHGFCSLERTGQFGASGAKGGFEVGLEALIAGFSSHKKAKKQTNAVR